MLVEYVPLILMVIVGFAFAIVFLFAAEWLGAKRLTKEKQTTYESGMLPFGNARERFSVKFYMVAVSFIVFDIEVVFLYPWATQLTELGLTAFIAVVIFIVILFAGYFYELVKGGFNWD
ncbi:MAG: NADH-quinone oxidoreductase subunit A [bacterium]